MIFIEDLISSVSSSLEQNNDELMEIWEESSESAKQNFNIVPHQLEDSELTRTNLREIPFFDPDIKIELEQFNSSENQINQRREEELHKNVTPVFLNLLKEEDFEFGYKTRSEEILREQLNINQLAAKNWLNELYVRYFHDEKILIGILRIIGRFDESTIFPQGLTMALAALIHQSDEVKELGIRAFEKWNSYNSLSVLKTVQVNTIWLQNYIKQIIEDLEEQLCHS